MSIGESLRLSGVDCDSRQTSQLETYASLLLEWNQKMNLTGARTEDEVFAHMLDCALALKAYENIWDRGPAIDVGTGAGFPGMVLAVLRPDIRFVLADALGKRCRFLEAVKEALHMDNAMILHARAEDMGRDADLRERFGLAMARAVAPMNVLCEYLLPLVQRGGHALCYKGPKAREELPAGQKAAYLLGGGKISVADSGLRDAGHMLYLIPKEKATPSGYPRRNGLPAQKPIE